MNKFDFKFRGINYMLKLLLTNLSYHFVSVNWNFELLLVLNSRLSILEYAA